MLELNTSDKTSSSATAAQNTRSPLACAAGLTGQMCIRDRMYAAGGEFTKNINAAGGPSAAEFAARAIEYYCRGEET